MLKLFPRTKKYFLKAEFKLSEQPKDPYLDLFFRDPDTKEYLKPVEKFNRHLEPAQIGEGTICFTYTFATERTFNIDRPIITVNLVDRQSGNVLSHNIGTAKDLLESKKVKLTLMQVKP